MDPVIATGIYAGVVWQIVQKNGKNYLALQAEAAAAFASHGANMKLLNDIGDQDGDNVMAKLMGSIPQPTQSA